MQSHPKTGQNMFFSQINASKQLQYTQFICLKGILYTTAVVLARTLSNGNGDLRAHTYMIQGTPFEPCLFRNANRITF